MFMTIERDNISNIIVELYWILLRIMVDDNIKYSDVNTYVCLSI